MTQPSDARKRTLALQARALRFSTGVSSLCPKKFSDLPSSVVWGQLVRAADSVSNNLLEADDASSTADFVHSGNSFSGNKIGSQKRAFNNIGQKMSQNQSN